MTRARELANFADNTAGLETLTVSDITDLSVSASNINSATNQITDSSTDLNVDSNTLVVDKSEDKVGILTASPTKTLTVNNTIQIQDSATPSASAGTHLGHSSNNFSVNWYTTLPRVLVLVGNFKIRCPPFIPAARWEKPLFWQF